MFMKLYVALRMYENRVLAAMCVDLGGNVLSATH
jgi:hypothetical protein